MEPFELDAVLRTLGHRRVYRYRRGDYALKLLRYHLDTPKPIKMLRRGPLARLLEKPDIRRCLAAAGGGVLHRRALARDGGVGQPYVLTFTRWGSCDPEDREGCQISRPGMNLVVQVNFDSRHDRAFAELVDPEGVRPFDVEGHPVLVKRNTLAWARVDVDPTNSEALIEELQSDWVANALAAYADGRDSGAVRFGGAEIPAVALTEYVQRHLLPHAQLWGELTLMASLELLGGLGIRRVFLHTLASSALKGEDVDPPRALYTELPRRFCFEQTARGPGFIATDSRWHRLDLPATRPLPTPRRRAKHLSWVELRADRHRAVRPPVR